MKKKKEEQHVENVVHLEMTNPKPAYKKAMWGEEVFKSSQGQRYKYETQKIRECMYFCFVLIIIHNQTK